MALTVLVTGASGFIALEICKQLLAEETFEVRGTVRNLANSKRNQPLRDVIFGAKRKMELFEADLTQPDSWYKAIEGVDVVVHTASPCFAAAPRQGELELVKPAVEGTLNVLQACASKNSKVRRVVLTSSIAAISYGTKMPADYVYTEKDWTDPNRVDPYSKSADT
jgi:nucleoside-diphosphate-sugar epimerase